MIGIYLIAAFWLFCLYIGGGDVGVLHKNQKYDS